MLHVGMTRGVVGGVGVMANTSSLPKNSAALLSPFRQVWQLVRRAAAANQSLMFERNTLFGPLYLMMGNSICVEGAPSRS